jgi:hypothetical protein
MFAVSLLGADPVSLLNADYYQELRRRQPFEGSADEVKTIRITYDPRLFVAQAEPPRCQEFS